MVLLSTLKLLRKSDRSTENWTAFPDLVKNPSAFPSPINITVLLMSSIPVKSFWIRAINGARFQQLLCHSTTLVIETLSSPYPQPTPHQPRTDSYLVFSSLRTIDSERKGLHVSFSFFQKNYLPDGRVRETVATVEELSDFWKSGAQQWMHFCRLWWVVIVHMCNFLFQLFDIYSSQVQNLLFSKI